MMISGIQKISGIKRIVSHGAVFVLSTDELMHNKLCNVDIHMYKYICTYTSHNFLCCR